MNYRSILFAGAITCTMAACSTQFLEEKRDLTGINEQVYQDPQLATAYVDYVYRMFAPADNAISFIISQNQANGAFNDQYTRTTDEIGGQTDLNREWAAIQINQNHAWQYFGPRMTASVVNNTWTRIKQINLFLDNVDQHGLPLDLRRQLKGQLLFWRAYQYFEMFRLYGGLPLVLTAQDPISSNAENLIVPRSSSSETIAQIARDLDSAIAMLPGRWPNANTDFGRITSGAAAALKGRALLTWASPLFNRNDDVARWQLAYDANLAAKTLLEANGFGLSTAGGTANGVAFQNMWDRSVTNPEAVFLYQFNNLTADQIRRRNGWEQAIRPRSISGAASVYATKQMMDAFPMRDGKMPGDPTSAYTYSLNKFYKDRDPRFLRTFAVNGSLWPFAGNANYRVWNYSWYSNASQANPNQHTEANSAASNIFVRKGSQANASNATAGGTDFAQSATPFIELRFAEVVLNLAEAAIGIGRLQEGLDGLKAIRQRAGLEAGTDGNFGLGAAAGNRDRLFGAIINERKIEFAYEGKRFWDLRRWLLYTDEFGTCTRLGQTPINGIRRTGIWVTVRNANGTRYNGSANPMVPNAAGVAPVINREPATFPPGISNMDQYVDYLYDNHFTVIEKNDLDPTNPANWSFRWYKEYYFFGLHQNILSTSPHLEQNQGWPDLVGAPGTFNPLQ